MMTVEQHDRWRALLRQVPAKDEDFEELRRLDESRTYRTASLDGSWCGPERETPMAARADGHVHLLNVGAVIPLYRLEYRVGDTWVPNGEISVRTLIFIYEDPRDGAIIRDDCPLFGGIMAPTMVIREFRREGFTTPEGWQPAGCIHALYALKRVISADALGPTEALYEKLDVAIEDVGEPLWRRGRPDIVRLLLEGGRVADLDRETGVLTYPAERWKLAPPPSPCPRPPKYVFEPAAEMSRHSGAPA